MSKNKKGKNRNYKKSDDKPVEESKLVKFIELIFKHHIILWLVIFPPVAFYRIFKYKILNKYVSIALLVMLAFLLFILTYSALNPTLIVDSQIEEYMTTAGYGTVREIEHIGVFDEYNITDVITTKGYYTIYFQYGEALEVKTIVSLQSDMTGSDGKNDFWVDYEAEDTNKLLGELNPAVTKFISQNDNYGKIESVLETTYGGQIIQTDKGRYHFYYKYYSTTSIDKWDEMSNHWTPIMNRDYVVKMKPEFEKALNQKKVIPLYYQIEEVTSYGVNMNEIYYIFTNFCGNQYRVVKFNDGRICIEAAIDNPVSQDNLEEMWKSYQETNGKSVE